MISEMGVLLFYFLHTLREIGICVRICMIFSQYLIRSNIPKRVLILTCSPLLKEINDALPLGQQVINRPGICAWTLPIKLRAMIAYNTNEEVFGKIITHVCLTEFQKRALSHAYRIHFLRELLNVGLLQPHWSNLYYLRKTDKQQKPGAPRRYGKLQYALPVRYFQYFFCVYC